MNTMTDLSEETTLWLKHEIRYDHQWASAPPRQRMSSLLQDPLCTDESMAFPGPDNDPFTLYLIGEENGNL